MKSGRSSSTRQSGRYGNARKSDRSGSASHHVHFVGLSPTYKGRVPHPSPFAKGWGRTPGAPPPLEVGKLMIAGGSHRRMMDAPAGGISTHTHRLPYVQRAWATRLLNRPASLAAATFGALLILLTTGACAHREASSNQSRQNAAADVRSELPLQPLAELSIWDDGLCEMSYYRASDHVYGKERSYTRVHMVNRQWMSRSSGVKAEHRDEAAAAVFKLNIAEQIPTENYNYRYLTTVFLTRPDLRALKMVTSSQEWCGTTFEHVRWLDGGAVVQSFSYLAGEGDHIWYLRGDPVPYEALFMIARDVVASGQARAVDVITPLRSTHQVEPTVLTGRLVPGPIIQATVAAGKYTARRVDLLWAGQPTEFVVEAQPPYRLLRYRAGLLHGELQHVERRPYWDQASKSSFYKQGRAP